jgi:hypothetical protein
MKSETINGVLVFMPDDMTDEEYLKWKRKKIAEINLYLELLDERRRNMSNEPRIIGRLRHWYRFVRNRLQWIWGQLIFIFQNR